MADHISAEGKGPECAVYRVSFKCKLDKLHVMQGGAASLAVFLETAPPPLYLVYMLAAGFGIPVSTDKTTF